MNTAALVAAIYKVDESALWRVIDTELAPREALVLSLRFGSKLTLKEVGLRLQRMDGGDQRGVTRERVRQIMIRALRKLRDPARRRKFELRVGSGDSEIRWTPLQLTTLLNGVYSKAQKPGRRVKEGGLYMSDWRAIFYFLDWLGEQA